MFLSFTLHYRPTVDSSSQETEVEAFTSYDERADTDRSGNQNRRAWRLHTPRRVAFTDHCREQPIPPSNQNRVRMQRYGRPGVQRATSPRLPPPPTTV